jgi:dihydroorotate dehydrogenase electron transfer subunit
MQPETAGVLSLTPLGQATGYYHLVLAAPQIAGESRPGQFVMVRCAEEQALDPLLARPLNIFRFHPGEGKIELIFRVVGRGTVWLAGRKPGDSLSLLGPLGNGFSSLEKYHPADCRRILLFAGGTGMPALFSLAEQEERADESKRGPEREFTLFYGARTKEELVFLDLWRAMGVAVHTATDDGSAGFHGTVTEAAAGFPLGDYDFYCACGPRPMLKAVQEMMAKHGVPGELCLEEFMACGVGACVGCVCETVHGYRRVCTDGPVFPAGEVIFS